MASFLSVQAGNWSDPLTWWPVYPVESINQGTKTFRIDGDHTTEFPATIQVTGANAGIYTVVSLTLQIDKTDIVVAESIPSATLSTLYDSRIPADGDSASVTWPVVLDVVVAQLIGLSVSNPLSCIDKTTDYLAGLALANTTALFTTDGNLSNTTSAASVEINGLVTFDDVTTSGIVTIDIGTSLTWSGIMNGSTLNMGGAALTGNDLVINNVLTSLSGNNFITGNITWTGSTVLGGSDGSVFGSNGDTMILKDDMLLDSAFWTVSGTVKVFKTFDVFHISTGGGAAVQLMNNTSANFKTNAVGVVVQYAGPAGGAQSNMRIGL